MMTQTRRPHVKFSLPEMINQRFGLWTVLGLAAKRFGQTRLSVRCDCGRERAITPSALRYGRTTGCPRCRNPKNLLRHGEYKSREYGVWEGMLRRTRSPSDRYYYNYGGRGIRVCERWAASFETFLQDMGRCPSDLHSIDRINNDGHYEPGNCRWATRSEQMRNTRSNRMVEHEGERLCVVEWAERFGLPAYVLYGRLRHYDWNMSRALAVGEHRPHLRRSA